VHYVIEPAPGISAARNRALSESGGDDLLAFIDDDEQPQDGWLVALVRTWQSSDNPALVAGLAVSESDGDLDPWVAAGEFFRRRRLATGSPITTAATDTDPLELFAPLEPRLTMLLDDLVWWTEALAVAREATA
jgi:Glycosyl transferase family 2.